MPDILRYIASNGDVLREICRSVGVKVEDDAHALIVGRAKLLLQPEQGFLPAPADTEALRRAMTEVAGEDSVACLEGAHKEVVAYRNQKPGTTLDRRAVTEKHGSDLEAFNIDAWSFEPSAHAMEPGDPKTAKQLAVAMEYYNTATALVLGGSSLLYARQTAQAA